MAVLTAIAPLVMGGPALSSDSVVGQRMAISFTVELHDGLMDRVIEVFGAREGLVSELVSLQVAPELFDVVELRSVFEQPLDPEPVGTFGKSRLACLAGMDRAVVEDEHDRLERDPELGPEAPVNLLQESDEVRTALGARGLHDQVARRPVEKAEHRDLLALARGRNAQIGSLLGPDMRQVGMGQRFGLVLEQQDDVARLGLRFEQLPAQTGAVHRVRILAALQRVTRPPPAKPPFFRSTTESREREMRRPERCSISLAKRGSVQFGRFATGADRSSSATSNARSALIAAGPGATVALSAPTPPRMNALRHSRTVSSRTPNASAISGLVQPRNVSRIARDRSASPRSRDWLSPSNSRLRSASATTGDLPTMIPPANQLTRANHSPHPLDRSPKPA